MIKTQLCVIIQLCETAEPSCVRDVCVVGVTGTVNRLSLVGSVKHVTTAQTAQRGKCDTDVGCRGRYGFKARGTVAASLTDKGTRHLIQSSLSGLRSQGEGSASMRKRYSSVFKGMVSRA